MSIPDAAYSATAGARGVCSRTESNIQSTSSHVEERCFASVARSFWPTIATDSVALLSATRFAIGKCVDRVRHMQ